MPKFDERFARQYRYEPPPEFPLASPYAGIVHHLSGPNESALAQTSPLRSWSAAVAKCRSMCLHFACRTASCTLARTLDSLVRVSRRVGYNLAPSAFVIKSCNRTHSMSTRRDLRPPMCQRTEGTTNLTRIAHTTTRGKTRRAPPVSSGPAVVLQPSPQQCAGNRSKKHCTTQLHHTSKVQVRCALRTTVQPQEPGSIRFTPRYFRHF